MPQLPPPRNYSRLEAMLGGAGQGLTFGYSDEIGGGIQAGLQKLGGSPQTLEELYRQARDQKRQELQAAQQQHPVAYGAADLGTSMLIPGGAAVGALKSGAKFPALMKAMGIGAGTGAVQEAGYSDDPTAAGMGVAGGLGMAGALIPFGTSNSLLRHVNTIRKNLDLAKRQGKSPEVIKGWEDALARAEQQAGEILQEQQAPFPKTAKALEAAPDPEVTELQRIAKDFEAAGKPGLAADARDQLTRLTRATSGRIKKPLQSKDFRFEVQHPIIEDGIETGDSFMIKFVRGHTPEPNDADKFIRLGDETNWYNSLHEIIDDAKPGETIYFSGGPLEDVDWALHQLGFGGLPDDAMEHLLKKETRDLPPKKDK